VRKPEDKKTLDRRNALGKIILKWTLKKKNLRNIFLWLRTGSTDGLLVNKVPDLQVSCKVGKFLSS
jgi:hypothetical protein